jgi:hypothetical protein
MTLKELENWKSADPSLKRGSDIARHHDGWHVRVWERKADSRDPLPSDYIGQASKVGTREEAITLAITDLEQSRKLGRTVRG